MKADLSRYTFNRNNHYTRVLNQQGRVQIDADSNEQTAIFWHYWQTLLTDMIGPHGGPRGNVGFAIRPDGDDLLIDPGRYYVHGMLCQNPEDNKHNHYYDQPYYQPDEDCDPERLPEQGPYLVYLDVWERHITHIQNPLLREVALRGPDTATRAQLIWQVKVQPLEETPNADEACDQMTALAERWRERPRGFMSAKAKENSDMEDLCELPPESRFRGKENQLYRVEIFKGGPADEASFVFSRDNGSRTYPILESSGMVFTLSHLGFNDRDALRAGDWVEIVDDVRAVRLEPTDEGLFRVQTVDPMAGTITLEVEEGEELPVYSEESETHPFIRRWDQRGTEERPLYKGVILLKEEEGEWIDLEDGIEVRFEPDGVYQRGDYWLIPARVATGDVEWPYEEPQPPHGIQHWYAPLAVIDDNGNVLNCRRWFPPMAVCMPAAVREEDR
jgi:hypothetical protein